MTNLNSVAGQNSHQSFDESVRQGVALFDQARFAEAAVLLRRAHLMSPGNLQVWIKLGTALVKQGDAAAAIHVLSALTHQHPYIVEAHGMLANAYMLAGDWPSAAAAFGRVLELAPNLAVAHFGMGSALANQGRIDQAIAAFSAAIGLNYPMAHCNLGVALLLTGAFDEAAAELKQAISFNPNDAVAHWNNGLLMLLRGDWENAWPEYEWRWRWNQFPSKRREFSQPLWNGEEIGGKTILLHAEQGFGDTIQLIRYLPLVASRGAQIMVECQAELQPVFSQLPGEQRWVLGGEELPEFDLHCPLASLPRIFNATTQTIPDQTPNLRAPADRLEEMRVRMGPSDGRPRVGLCWAGNATFNGDQTRSIKLEQLRGILAIQGIQFFSLQKGAPAERIRPAGFASELIDLGSDFRDFGDTAAAISLCDIVITTDTSVPHLAGAMGKPLWVMLQHVPDWRWLLHRDDSPWYPSARLFRQSSLGDWDSVIRRVASELAKLRE